MKPVTIGIAVSLTASLLMLAVALPRLSSILEPVSPLIRSGTDSETGVPSRASLGVRQNPTSAISVDEPEAARTPETPRFLYRWRDADGTVHIESNRPESEESYAVHTLPLPRGLTTTPADQSARTPEVAASPERISDDPWRVYLPGGSEELQRQLDETLRKFESRQEIIEKLSDEL